MFVLLPGGMEGLFYPERQEWGRKSFIEGHCYYVTRLGPIALL